MKLADFGVSVLARGEEPLSPAGRVVSPLVALLTGEPELSDSSMTPSAFGPEQDDEDVATAVRAVRLPPSKVSGRRQARTDDLTEVGMLIGTPMYMAPEISYGSRHAQPSSDIFSLGVIAYELLTRQTPFKRPPIGMMMRKEKLQVPLGLRERGDLDPKLVALFERALSSDPSQRPTAAEIAAALAPPDGS